MRVKRGFARRRKRARLLKQTEGFRGRKGNCYKLAKRGLQKALKYAYRDRKVKKRSYRALWIVRINAASRECGLTYGKLISGLKRAKVELDRKALADLAFNNPTSFKAIAEKARAALA